MTATPEHGPDTTETLAPGVWVRRTDLSITFTRSGGPGGQSVNKVNTAATLRLAVTAINGLDAAARSRLRRAAGQRLTKIDELVIQSQTHRSQADNRRACLERLRDLVETARIEPVKRRPTRPSRAMIRRRLENKRRQSEKKRLRRTRKGGSEDA